MLDQIRRKSYTGSGCVGELIVGLRVSVDSFKNLFVVARMRYRRRLLYFVIDKAYVAIKTC